MTTIPHVGEWKVAFVAPTLPDLFGEVARFIAGECGPVAGEPGAWEEVSLSSRDLPGLLVDWCNELVGRSEAAGRAYPAVRNLHFTGPALRAEAQGVPVSDWRLPIKAATWHGADVEMTPGGWRSTLLLDI